MKRLALKDSVTITGSSPVALGLFAKKQAIEMRPLSLAETQITRSKNETGWYWKTTDGALVPIDMSLVREAREMRAERSSELRLHPRHYLYFQHGKDRLNCVEHILALKLLGLDGVVIEAHKGTTWVPYDGRAKMYWEAIQDHLKYDGRLEPMAIRLSHAYEDIAPKFGWTRSVAFSNEGESTGLVAKVIVDYSMFGGKEVVERYSDVADPSKMADVLCSRPLLQPLWLESNLPLMKAIGWPHADNLLKRSEFNEENPKPFLHEIALHRMLDLFGAVAVLAEAGTYVTGSIVTDKGNHGTDLLFLQQVKTKARDLFPDLEFLAPLKPSRAEPKHHFLWVAGADKSAKHCDL